MAWLTRCPDAPYFCGDDGSNWTPIGHNDAITWPELAPLFRRRDVDAVRRHLQGLKAHGVTCLRLMLEYAQVRHRYLERPAGRFVPAMVQLWDDLFALCEEVGLYLLLTPFDTFFSWRHWQHHPYNAAKGGPCHDRRQWMTSRAMRDALRKRLEFVTTRWGGSPALFAWDLWNELHPAHGEDDPANCVEFVDEISGFLRAFETRLHGRAHLQTVSIFGPELITTPGLIEPVFRHRTLDFATVHLYEFGTIDDPPDTVAPALAVGRLMREALAHAPADRPVLDSEHGPIHAFIDRHETLPAAFDDEYFRHIQWAHFASGGAGGGMRWPNRHPHVLTPGMRRAQQGLSEFLPLIQWHSFQRRNLNHEVGVTPGVAAFACADPAQAVVWLLRRDSLADDGRVRPASSAQNACAIRLPGLVAGLYRLVEFDTASGRAAPAQCVQHQGGDLCLQDLRLPSDLALAIRLDPSAKDLPLRMSPSARAGRWV